jgi:phosphoribosylamine--glycine ligase
VKVLVIGGGGREHALAWKLAQSKHVNKIYASPGNAGIAELAECIDLSPNNFSAIVDFVRYEWIDLTIVCSEKLLAEGIVDFFDREGRRILGPNRKAAQVGLSRVFAKNLMRLHGIPTPEYKVFTSYLHALDYIRLKSVPIVIKTDGRSVENNSFFASTTDEAMNILKLIMEDRVFGDDGRHVVIEEQLVGERISFLAFTDGKTVAPFTSLYIYRGDETGSNMMGMGAYSPVYRFNKELRAYIMEKIMEPLLRAFHSEGIKHKGFISADLIVNDEKAHVFELNCCLKELEAQTVLPRMNTDLIDMVSAVMEERLSGTEIEVEENASVCIVGAAERYPKSPNGVAISGLETIKMMEDVIAFHENTFFDGSNIITPGGGVICVTATGKDPDDAKVKAYDAIEKIHFDGVYYRKDIAKKIL